MDIQGRELFRQKRIKFNLDGYRSNIMFLKATKTYAFLIKKTSKNSSISLRHRLKKILLKNQEKKVKKTL